MAQLSEWLQIMLAEIERKQEEAQRAIEEEAQRKLDGEQSPQTPPWPPKYLSTQA
jgi:hypothetical protein